MRSPRIGDIIEYTDYRNQTHKGEVLWVGSAQFMYYDPTTVVTQQNGETSKGAHHSCLFNQDWKIVKRKPISRREVKEKIQQKKQRDRDSVSSRSKRRRKSSRNDTG